jgi:hypothetical protein
MEPATIMVLVLCAGVAALLVWFEINSRRNEASKKQAAMPAQSASESLQTEDQSKAESKIDKRNAA